MDGLARRMIGTTPERLALSLLAAGLLSLCVWPQEAHGAARPPCALATDGVLLLRGETDDRMLQCLKAIETAPVTTVVIDSPGGPVGSAIPIADIIQRWRAAVIVRGACNSSCANYILPVARRVTLEPGAVVMIHGSVDENALARGVRRDLFDLQQAFTARNGVHPGWLLFRDAADRASGSNGRYVDGAVDAGAPAGDVDVRFILVDEAFMRSCLIGIDIAPFNDTVVQRLYRNKGLRARLARQGIHPSGTLACKPAASPEADAG